MARQIAEKREARERAAMQAKRRVRRSLEDFMASMEKGESQELNLILKGDVSGSVEALEDALAKIDVGDEVVPARHRPRCRCDHRDQRRPRGRLRRDHHRLQRPPAGQGEPRWPTRKVSRSATTRSSTRRSRRSRRRSRACSSPIYEESTLGQAEIREIFRSSKAGNIAGCMVTLGSHPPQRQGADPARRRGGGRQPRPVLAAPREGRRVRGPRGLRVRSGAPELPGHQDRRHRRVVRDARDRRAADHRAGTSCPSVSPTGHFRRAPARGSARSARPGARKCPVIE